MKKHVVGVLTATRAEYGLLKPVIMAMKTKSELDVKVLVTGMHLSPEFGMTYHEMQNDGIEAAVKIPILLSDDTPAGVSKSMALALIGFSDYFSQNRIDMLLVLGDRFETLAVCSAAFNARIPIVHLYGGETTEGAVDEAFRHAITKMSCLHFTSTEQYRRRVIQLGENPNSVYNVGSLGVQNALESPKLSRSELQEVLGFDLAKPYAVVTFHPVTLEDDSSIKQCSELLFALADNSHLNYLITKANADSGGRQINELLDAFAHDRDNVYVVSSLGERRYLSALKYASLVIGNSSSGIVEAPSFGVPVVNIGDRQKGRIQSELVINCLPDRNSISKSIERGLSEDIQRMAKDTLNPYYQPNTTERIVNIIFNCISAEQSLKKTFYDIDFEV